MARRKKDPRMREATRLLTSERAEEALVLFRAILADRSDDAAAWDDVGWALSEVGRRDEAIAHFDRALELAPTLVNAWVGRGMALEADPDAALGCFDRALELDPACAQAWFLRGCVLADLGRADEAQRDKRRASELDPGMFGPPR